MFPHLLSYILVRKVRRTQEGRLSSREIECRARAAPAEVFFPGATFSSRLVSFSTTSSGSGSSSGGGSGGGGRNGGSLDRSSVVVVVVTVVVLVEVLVSPKESCSDTPFCTCRWKVRCQEFAFAIEV